MNAPQKIDLRPALRDDVAEHLAMVRLHAEIAQKWLEVPDDPAAEYAVARMITYIKLSASSMRALRNVNQSLGTKSIVDNVHDCFKPDVADEDRNEAAA